MGNFKKIIEKNIKYLYSLIYGIFGSLGFICYFNLMCMAAFHNSSKYPNGYPIYTALGWISLLICIVTFICNIETLMKEKNRIKYILIELIFTVLFFILFGNIISFVGNKLSEIF